MRFVIIRVPDVLYVEEIAKYNATQDGDPDDDPLPERVALMILLKVTLAFIFLIVLFFQCFSVR